MRLFFKILLLSVSFTVFGQIIPINSDYLSDNIYLVHPAAAGVGNTGKIRFTAKKQWLGIKNAPSFQTLSFHNRFNKKSAIGLILANDENGYFSQKGIQTVYAYHLDMSFNQRYFSQLSFAVSASFYQNQVNKSDFGDQSSDPVLALSNSRNNFNVDFGVAYHYRNFYSYLTVRNILLFSDTQSINRKKYLFYLGQYFNFKKGMQYEPSLMIFFDEYYNDLGLDMLAFLNTILGQKYEYYSKLGLDLNMKVYKKIPDATLWFAISYRVTKGTKYFSNYISPIVGINYKRYVFSYTYREQFTDVNLINNGSHQITLGINVFEKKFRQSACPNINAGFLHYGTNK